jgi:glutamine phosphoribosylpyrophosphate amidotransferase
MATEINLVTFRSPRASWRYIFRNGVAGHFINHIFVTSDPAEVDELRREMKQLELVEVSAESLEVERADDPIAVMRAKMRKELLEEIAAKTKETVNPGRDLGSADKVAPVPASSEDVALMAAADANDPSGAVLMSPAAVKRIVANKR